MTSHQSQRFEEPCLFDERDSGPMLMKLWFPLLLWLGVAGLYQSPEKLGGLVLLGLLAAAGFFLFSLALIMPSDQGLRYRRFIRWHAISYDEIVKCDRYIFPGLGYIKLKRFVPPWGKLYFVFYAPTASPFDRAGKLAAHKAVLQYIRDKMASPDAGSGVESKSTPNTTQVQEKGSVGKCLLWTLLGLIWAVFLRAYLDLGIPVPRPPFATDSVLYRWAVSWWKFGVRLLDWPYNVVVVLGIFALIVAWKCRRKAWGAAAALGFFLGELFVRFLQR